MAGSRPTFDSEVEVKVWARLALRAAARLSALARLPAQAELVV